MATDNKNKKEFLKVKIKARFDSVEKAEYVSSLISEKYPFVHSDTTTLHDITGYYSYCAVLPNATVNTGYMSGMFCPVFPENATIEDVRKSTSALMQIKCSPENSRELHKIIMSCGGRLLQ